MTSHYNAKAERERRERDNNPDRILHLARSKGCFSVSLRYRDESLRRICSRLTKKGLLAFGGRRGGSIVYFPKVNHETPEPVQQQSEGR
jgi:CRISPR/Cas system CMR subunit Cmr6 (Cas7 group RAMP superfamily)